MSFLGFGNRSTTNSPSSSFGYKIVGNAGVPTDLENMKGNIIKTSRKYREELTKYREIAKFNQQISNGYMKNLEAMVDVSRILNYYVDIFNLLREEFDKNDRLLGASLKSSDIGYLERLTKSKIDELNTKFMTETEKLKKMYSQYNRSEELSRVQEAQNMLKATSDSADVALNNFRAIEQQGVQGGANRKFKKYVPLPKKPKRKQPKKKST